VPSERASVRTADGDARLLAKQIRSHVLRMVHAASASHVGTCLSMADLLAVLYARVLHVDPAAPDDDERDRLFVGKGHGAAGVYAALAERGFFPVEWLARYCADGSPLAGHLTQHGVPGVELSTGSLGHALGVACGVALAGKRGGRSYRVFTLLSDGECDEGSTWEAALFAPHHHLDNLVAIVDANGIQSFGSVDEVLRLEPLPDKWRAFGWDVREIDGHDVVAIEAALASAPWTPGRPSAVIARTVKGNGVSFMEGALRWHYKSPDASELALALAEVERS